MATILIALGSTAEQGAIEVSGIVRNLSFEQGLLTVASLGVLVFMLVGYYREECSFLSRHTDFALAHRLHKQADVIEEITAAVTEIAPGVHSAARLVQDFEVQLNSIQAQLRGQFDGWKLDAEGKGKNGQTPALLPEATGQLEIDHTTRPERLISIARDAANNAEVEARRFIYEEITLIDDELQRTLREALLELENTKQASIGASHQTTTAMASIAKIAPDIRGFADTIGPSTKRWFWAYDAAPCYLLALVAIIVALWRLIDPSGLAAWIAYLF